MIMNDQKTQKRNLFLYIFSMLLFGSNGVAASRIALDSYQIVFMRTVLGFLTIALLFFLTRHRLTVFRHPRDLLFVALCVWLISVGRPIPVILGALGLYWYGQDAWFQAKVLWQEKHYRPAGTEPGCANRTGEKTEEDSKITVTNLQDAKEVDFEKE